MLQNRSRKNHLLLTETERDAMRAAGRFNAQLLDYVRPYVQPGITTGELDRLVHDFTVRNGNVPATLGYMGYPKSCCTSVNEVICHGIPDNYVLREGDIINVDVTSIVDGWFGDQSETFFVGPVSDVAVRLTQCSFDSLWQAIRSIGPESFVSDIAEAIMPHARKCGFSVVSEYVGHGLGRQFHQDPSVPHFITRQFLKSKANMRLEPGLCFTIEPMINAGQRYTVQDRRDGWTVRTKDGSLSAQFEHTILMTEEGPEILTLTKDGPQEGHRFQSPARTTA